MNDVSTTIVLHAASSKENFKAAISSIVKQQADIAEIFIIRDNDGTSLNDELDQLLNDSVSVELTGVLFSGNKATIGAGVLDDSGMSYLVNSTFSGNNDITRNGVLHTTAEA